MENNICYWYDEDKDMGATIPYCRLKGLYGSQEFDEQVGECKDFISEYEVDEIVKGLSETVKMEEYIKNSEEYICCNCYNEKYWIGRPKLKGYEKFCPCCGKKFEPKRPHNSYFDTLLDKKGE